MKNAVALADDARVKVRLMVKLLKVKVRRIDGRDGGRIDGWIDDGFNRR